MLYRLNIKLIAVVAVSKTDQSFSGQ